MITSTEIPFKVRTRTKLIGTGLAGFLTVSSLYMGSLGLRTLAAKKVQGPQVIGEVLKPDPELGYTTLPNAKGLEDFPSARSRPVWHDEYGFRRPVVIRKAAERPLTIVYGCSYTYGDGVDAEDTYAHELQELLGTRVLNAGMNGASAAQMVLLAKRQLPELKPERVIFQFSDWLTDRSIGGFCPSRGRKLPTPFVYEDNEGSLQIHAPYWEYEGANHKGLLDFFRDDVMLVRTRIKQGKGIMPLPSHDTFRITKFLYDEMEKIARANNAQPVYVVLGENTKPIDTSALRDYTHVVNAHQELLDSYPSVQNLHDDAAFTRVFMQWRGEKEGWNLHPNEHTNHLIATSIYQRLKQ